MEVVCSSEMSVNNYHIERCRMLEDSKHAFETSIGGCDRQSTGASPPTYIPTQGMHTSYGLVGCNSLARSS
jgi:hypothetical protein